MSKRKNRQKQSEQNRSVTGIPLPQLTLEDRMELGLVRSKDRLGHVAVEESSVMGLSPWWNGILVYQASMSGMPIRLYEDVGDGREEATDHELYNFLMYEPCRDLTKEEFIGYMMGNALTHGFGIAEIEFAGQRPKWLWPIHPSSVRIVVDEEFGFIYEVTIPGGEKRYLPDWRAFIIRGPGHPAQPFSVIDVARTSFGSALEMENFGEKFFRNNCHMQGYFTHEGIPESHREQLRQDLTSGFSGTKNAFKNPILPKGMDFKPVSFSPEQVLFVSSKEFSHTQISQYLNLAPMFINIYNRMTWSNSSIVSRQLVQQSLKFWIDRWQSQIRKKLLLPSERYKFHPIFDTTELLRGDFETRMTAYESAIKAGILGRNEIRYLEGWDANPLLERPVMGKNISVLDDKGVPINPAPGGTVTGTTEDGTEIEIPGQSPPAKPTQDTEKRSQQLLNLQSAYYGKTLPRDAVIANAVIALGVSQQQAEALFPELPPDAPEPEPEATEGMPEEAVEENDQEQEEQETPEEDNGDTQSSDDVEN